MDGQDGFARYPVITTFDVPGDFEATRAAERWLAERDYSVGHAQRGAPRGILHGDFDIQKWRNLRRHEREALDGLVLGDTRNGPVIVRLTALPSLTTETEGA